MQKKIEQSINSIFAIADVKINGNNPWDIQVYDERFYTSILNKAQLGFGEAYMAGWWDCAKLDICIEKIAKFNLVNYLKDQYLLNLKLALFYLKSKLINQQTSNKAYDVGKAHYDLGNDLFQKMLDPSMSYSCAYWKTADNLVQAQQDKLKLICEKLYLKPGMKLLDIGCGWGGLAQFAAENYGVEVTGITISKEQHELATIRCKNLPVNIKLADYRTLDNKYDRIVSVGMFEHVGYKNYANFMEITQNLLTKDGLFLLHTIGSSVTTYAVNPWIDKYIFPHGMLPSIKQIGQAIEKKFVMEDWHNFGSDYDKTLMAWHENFVANWPHLSERYGEHFFKMWKFYLLSCAGCFRARELQLWQIVLSQKGALGGYQSLR